MARSCVFCGGTPVTNEHVYPRWLAKGFPEAPPTERAIMVSHSDHDGPRRHSGRLLTTQVKAVCEPCNSGWMSVLEARVQPYLLPMIKGEITELSPEAQQVLATWTVKTALMCQVFHAQEPPLVPAELFTDLYRDRAPADEMKVFCAYMMQPQYFNGPSPIEHRSMPSRNRDRTDDGQEFDRWATVVTMRIGYAVLQLLAAGPKGLRYEIGHGDFSPYVQSLWPVRETFSWPPLAMKRASEFDAFADPLSEVKRPFPRL